MKGESKVILLGCVIFVAILVLIGTNTNIGTLGTLSTQGIAPNLSITLDKTQYSLGDTVTIKMDCRTYASSNPPSKTTQGTIISYFKVVISLTPLPSLPVTSITVKAIRIGTANQYTGTTQYKIPLTGSIATIKISVTAYDAKGIGGQTATTYITRAKAFYVTSVLTTPQPI